MNCGFAHRRLHTEHYRGRGILHIVVRMAVEPGHIIVAQTPEMVVLTFYNQASDNQRNADVCHLIESGRENRSSLPLKLLVAEIRKLSFLSAIRLSAEVRADKRVKL